MAPKSANRPEAKPGVLLVSPDSKTRYGDPRYPMIGISMIAAVLRKAGYPVCGLDMRFSNVNDDDFLGALEEFRPAVVGFTVTHWDILEADRLAGIAKKTNKEIVTIFGGPQPTLCPEKTLELPGVDILVCGEGEETVVELVRALEEGRPMEEIKGIAYRDGKGAPRLPPPREAVEDISSLPWPAFDLFGLSRYASPGGLRLAISGSRGCPFNCIFCTSNSVMGRRVRYREPSDVIAEMKHWNASAGIEHFLFSEDNFLSNRQKAVRFMDELEKSGLPVTFSLDVGVRADSLTAEICERLKKSGCTSIAIGIESSDPDVLKLANKGEDIETIARGIRTAKKAGLLVKGYFIVGLPGDSKEKVRRSVDFARREQIDLPRFSLAQAFPNTKMTEWVNQNGHFYYAPYDYALAYPNKHHSEVHFDFPGFPKEEIWKSYLWAYEWAEKQAFRNVLRRKFGDFPSRILNLFNIRIFRDAVTWLYKHRLISLPG